MTTIAALSDALLQAVLAAGPVDATLLGFRSYDRLLPDLSESAVQARVDVLQRLLGQLDTLATDSIDEVLEVDILRAFVLGLLDHEAARTADFTVTDYFGSTIGSLLTSAPMIVLSEPAHADDYLHRLRAVPTLLATAAARASAGTTAGRTAVAPLVQRAADQIDRYLGDPEGDPFLAPTPPAGWAGADDFTAERRRILTDDVRPAMAAYRDAVLAAVLPHARTFDRPGLTWLPGGDESYAALVRLHTTTNRTPAEIHQLGLNVIAGLAREYAEVGGRLYGTTEPTEIFRRIRTDPTLPTATPPRSSPWPSRRCAGPRLRRRPGSAASRTSGASSRPCPMSRPGSRRSPTTSRRRSTGPAAASTSPTPPTPGCGCGTRARPSPSTRRCPATTSSSA